jgi:prophage regulatory protein
MDGKTQRIVRMRDLPALVGLSRSAIYKSIAQSEFPPGFRLTKNGRAVGWLVSDIAAWIESRSKIATRG